MKASNGLTFFRQFVSIFLITSIFLIPYEYCPLMIFIFICLLACWKYNDGRCFSRMYEMDTESTESQDKTEPQVSIEDESSIYPVIKSYMSYSSYESIFYITLFISSIILLIRYIYQFDMIPLVSSLRTIYFGLGFVLSIGFFLFSFICISGFKSTTYEKQSHIILFLFLLTMISFSYIYLYDKPESNEDMLNKMNINEIETTGLIPNYLSGIREASDSLVPETFVPDLVHESIITDSFEPDLSQDSFVQDSFVHDLVADTKVYDSIMPDLVPDTKVVSNSETFTDSIPTEEILERVNDMIQKKQS